MRSTLFCTCVFATLAMGSILQEGVSYQEVEPLDDQGELGINYSFLASLLPKIIDQLAENIRWAKKRLHTTLNVLSWKKHVSVISRNSDLTTLIDQMTAEVIQELKQEDLNVVRDEIVGSAKVISEYLKNNKETSEELKNLLADWLHAIALFLGGQADLLDRTGQLMDRDEFIMPAIVKLVTDIHF